MVKSENGPENIFYIDRVEFMRSLMENAFKAKGVDIYTIDTLENNFYLLDDLLPDLIIFDVDTVLPYLDTLKSYQDKAILVAVGNPASESLVKDMIKCFIAKPIEVKNIANRLLSILD